jgi:DNA-binding YbaB/EbfC family protein
MDIVEIMRQARELKKNFEQTQTELEAMTVAGAAGGGLVKAEVSGLGRVKRIEIDKSLAKPEEVEMLEDLIVAAVGDAQRKAVDEMKSRTGRIGEGMNLPFNLPF